MNSMERPKIVVAGAGAMGCLFGGLLAEKGLEVVLLDVWVEHVETIQRAGGLRMVGFGGDRLVALKATTDPKSIGSADVVFFQSKALHNESAARSVMHLFTGNTVAISFQNGLGNEEVIGSVIGISSVLGGLTSQGASMEGPGVVRNYAELPSQIGELSGGLSERARRLAATFSAHGLPTEARENIRKDKWKKLFANIAFSATSGGTGLTLGEVAALPELASTALRAIAEAAAVAAADGLPMDQGTTEEVYHQLVGPGGSGANKSSLRRDLEHGRRSEVDFIYGTVIALGDKHGVPTPTLKTLAAIIKGIEHHHSIAPAGARQ